MTNTIFIEDYLLEHIYNIQKINTEKSTLNFSVFIDQIFLPYINFLNILITTFTSNKLHILSAT